MELTKDDVTALKQTDRVCFRLVKNGEHPLGRRAAGEITLIKESNSESVFTQQTEAERTIACEGFLPGFARKAFAMRYTTKPAFGAWSAFLALVRTGDELILSARENGNGYTRAAVIPAGKLEGHELGYTELHCDEMLLTLRRKGKTIFSELEVASSVCPDNSARMIQ